MNTLTVALSRGTCRPAGSDRKCAVWRLCSPRAWENILHEYGGKARGIEVSSECKWLSRNHSHTDPGKTWPDNIFTVGEPVIYKFIGNLVTYV